jgi:two-component system nitrate/nitrite response regulator NarL
LEVATLVRDGLPNKQIAWRLGMSEGTVKAHLSAVMRVLGVRNRVLLVRRMEELGHLK